MSAASETPTQSAAIVTGAAPPLATAQASTYDAVPYSLSSFAQTHPDRMATIATLLGMKPAHPGRCRVLELGCARGGNLIPMALGCPKSRFVGIDLSSRQIEDGCGMLRELGLSNVELKALSITDIDDDFGMFDYIICHGVYSWVPPQVQEKILEICKRNLAPQGVAYVSYNTLPGWHARGAIREMLWYHTERFADPAERVRESRALLGFLAKSVSANDGGYGALVRQELAVLAATADSYLLHEHLEDDNEPLYFHQFAERAAEKGLQYLGEAHFPAMFASKLGTEVEKTLREISPDLLHMEQYMDFVRNRMFRQTLLCHADVKVDHALRPEIGAQFYVASSAKPVNPQVDVNSAEAEQFRVGEDLTLTTRDPLMKAAMMTLVERYPLATSFSELVPMARRRRLVRKAGNGAVPSTDDERQLATRLLNCYTSALAEFSLLPSPFTIEVSERPIASPYARLRARIESKATNMRLESTMLSRPALKLLELLDGKHDRDQLVAMVTEMMKSIAPRETPAAHADPSPVAPNPLTAEGVDSVDPGTYVDAMLHGFARSALLVG